MCYGVDVTYLQYVPSVAFLTEKPDITIVYNQQRLDEIYFSLDTEPGDKYDFISLAIRDIVRGLGCYHNFLYNRVEGEIQNVKGTMLPFEKVIDEALGTEASAEDRLARATQGELPLYDDAKLYAPATWENGVSLNFFTSGSDVVSQILSYDFGKGTVRRSLNAQSEPLFRNLLGWKYCYPVGISTPSNSTEGGTEWKMEYGGSFNLGDLEPAYNGFSIDDDRDNCSSDDDIHNDDNQLSVQSEGGHDSDWMQSHLEAVDYAYQFYPYYNPAFETPYSPGDGFTVSILKKDGTWDVVFAFTVYFPGMNYELNMSECEFHCDPDEYERTVEGYLRARIATNFTTNGGYKELRSTYFVIDYLPPKVKLRYNFLTDDIATVSDGAVSPNATKINVRIYFSDIEEANRVVLERQRQGLLLPTKINVTDFKKGYFDTTIDLTTTFTAVAYNDNGQTRGVPITIEPLMESSASALRFQMQDDIIIVNATEGETGVLDYNIMPLTATASQFNIAGNSDGEIDISSLPQGLYVLNVTDYKTGLNGTFKFKK